MTKSGLPPSSIFRPKPLEISPRLLKRRKIWNKTFLVLGGTSVLFSCALLVGILGSIIYWSIPAFLSVELKLTVPVSKILKASPEHLADRTFLLKESLANTYPTLEDASQTRQIQTLYSLLAQKELRSLFKDRDALKKVSSDLILWVPAQKDVAAFLKHLKKSPDAKDHKAFRLTNFQRQMLKKMETEGNIRFRFNGGFFKFSDSQTPELAGIYGALIGSLYVLGIALLFSLPIGVITAVYLEEFANDSRLNRWIEINLNNLAAVPSVVFGLLGLSVFLNFFKLPRSSSLVGGLTLGLMLLPIMIVSSRIALRSVPSSIRDAARGIGASSVQVVFHHVIPLAFPGILTGSLIGIARAMGESASLLMVGMMAFITTKPHDLLSPATVLPIEIYQWVERPERGFDELSSAAILILLCILGGLNWAALFLKHKFEKRW